MIHKNRPSKTAGDTRLCENCGKPYEAKRDNQTICGLACQEAKKRRRQRERARAKVLAQKAADQS